MHAFEAIGGMHYLHIENHHWQRRKVKIRTSKSIAAVKSFGYIRKCFKTIFKKRRFLIVSLYVLLLNIAIVALLELQRPHKWDNEHSSKLFRIPLHLKFYAWRWQYIFLCMFCFFHNYSEISPVAQLYLNIQATVLINNAIWLSTLIQSTL